MYVGGGDIERSKESDGRMAGWLCYANSLTFIGFLLVLVSI